MSLQLLLAWVGRIPLGVRVDQGCLSYWVWQVVLVHRRTDQQEEQPSAQERPIDWNLTRLAVTFLVPIEPSLSQG